MDTKQKFDLWVDKVMAYAAEAGPRIGRHVAAMQSEPFFDRQSDILFLGINPAEEGSYSSGGAADARGRFYVGNCFPPEVWHNRWDWVFNPESPDNAFAKAGWGEAVRPGRYLFFNVVFFGSPHGGTDIAAYNDIIHHCVGFSAEAITDIFRPRCVICFSVPKVFDRLNSVMHFDKVQRIERIMRTDGTPMVHRVMCGEKDGIRFYGIPHFTGYWRVTKADFDAIVVAIHEDLLRTQR